MRNEVLLSRRFTIQDLRSPDLLNRKLSGALVGRAPGLRPTHWSACSNRRKAGPGGPARTRASALPWLGLLMLAGACWADTKPEVKEEPVGLVLNPGGGKLLRADTETPLALRAGDLLFSGDGLRTDASPASYLFCPAKTIQTLSASGEVRLDAKQPKVKTGKISDVPAKACTLPQTLRVAVASQQHYGVTMTRGGEDSKPVSRDQLPADLKAALAPLDAALAADPNDPGALVSEATLFEDRKFSSNALDIYKKVQGLWPDAVWVKSKIFDLAQLAAAQAAAATPASPDGNTYALLIGVSKYKKPELNLQFANQDAIDLAKFLQSPRGGGLPAGNILLLTDEKATTAAVRSAFNEFLKGRAGKNDTVVIMAAGHGTVEKPGTNGAYILTYDADPQDLASTALPMKEVADLFTEQLKSVRRVLLFVDVCKAGTIGTIHSVTVNSDVQQLGDIDGDMFGLLASRPKELSQEGPQFGGGHGAFSYFLIKGLDGEADANKDGVVDANELIKYVSSQVPTATMDKQHPREFGTYENTMRLSDTKKPGIQITQFRKLQDARNGGPIFTASAQQTPPLSSEASSALDKYNQALAAGRVLPNQAGNAFDALKPLQSQLLPDRYREASNQLRVALENRGQETLLRYLAGDENPQTQTDFDLAGRYMAAARTLTPESIYLEGREDFFEGRTLLFDDTKVADQTKTKRFNDAVDLLEKSVRLDPSAAYGYNALGIAYLEEAQYDRAIPAFRDAARRAQHWSYPLHNLALAYVETGDTRSAIRAYQDAIRLTPTYSYLPYNLGLVYQRLNRRKDAEASYRKALMLAPNSAEPLNALGTLKASEGKRTEAEQFYRQALMRKPDLLPARHNLALLLASDKGRQMEAVDLFRANLTQAPDYLPSRLSLAETLAATDSQGAIQEYRKVLIEKPGFIAARLALAQLLAKTGDKDGAITELRQAAGVDNQNPDVLEQIGDLEASAGHNAEAQTAYDQAAKLTQDSAARKRLKRKESALH
jgi:tetratricopeptide (TPR) repeat protein